MKSFFRLGKSPSLLPMVFLILGIAIGFSLCKVSSVLAEKEKVVKGREILDIFGEAISSNYICRVGEKPTMVFSCSLDSLREVGAKFGEPLWHYRLDLDGNTKFIDDGETVLAESPYCSPTSFLKASDSILVKSSNRSCYYYLAVPKEGGNGFEVLFFPAEGHKGSGLAYVSPW